MTTVFNLTLYDTTQNRELATLLNKLEVAFNDVKNSLPQSYYDFIEKMEYGKAYKFTFEELDAS